MRRTHVVAGVVLTILGGAYLLDAFGLWSIRLAVLGPVLRIAAGAALLLPPVAGAGGRTAGPRSEC